MTKKEMKNIKRKAKKAKKVAKKLGWKRILIILAIVVALCVGFLGFSYFKYNDPFYFFRPTVEEQDSSSSSSSNNSTVTNNAVVPGVGEVPNTFYAVISKEQYYKDIDFTQTGDNLRNALNVKINTDTKYNSYGDARYMLIYTDERVDKKGTLYGMYDGKEYEPKWDGHKLNREHVWPCNKMRRAEYTTDKDYRPNNNTKDYRSDLHNLRMATASVNQSRSDKYFDLKTTDFTYFPNLSTNPEDDFRGDVARILFYMELRYEDLELVEKPTDQGIQMGKLSVLKQWNELDPVDEFEIQRNNRIYEYQGNRNPFIDYPELVSTLY